MSDLLTPAELAAIADREAKATPGPLQVNTLNGYPRTLEEMKTDLCACLDLSVASGRSVPAIFVVSTGLGDDGLFVAVTGNGPTSEANAHFIAHARTDIPALLRHIAALEARTPAPAHCQCAECKPWLDAEKPAPALPADMDALLAEAEDEAPVAGSFRDLIQRLATALRESRAREGVAYAAGERVGYHAAIARAEKAEAELATARAELGALGEVEWEWRATDSHYWDACPHCNGKKNCGRVGKHRAMRVVKEAK